MNASTPVMCPDEIKLLVMMVSVHAGL